MAGISYTISLKLPNEVIYETVMSLVILFLFFMSTALFPTENVSVFFRVLLTLNPFVYSINFLRSLILENTINWNSFFIMTIIFSVLCIIIFFVSVKTLEKQTDS
jgi:ABC-2 type transport system permease protein